METKSCEITFGLRDYGSVDGFMRNNVVFTVIIETECHRFRDRDLTTLESFWSWSDDDRAKVAAGYKIRGDELKFYLPNIVPLLESGQEITSICGPIEYSFTQAVPSFMGKTNHTADLSVGIEIDIETADETIVRNKPDFEYWWVFTFTANLENYEETEDVIFEFPETIRFNVTDYCLGWYPSPYNITVLNTNTLTNYTQQESVDDPTGLYLQKYIKQPRTVFDFHNISYYQHKYDIQDQDCGVLVYTPKFWTVGYLADMVYNRDVDYIQPKHHRFYLDAFTAELQGQYIFEIDIVASDLIYGPTHTVQITLDIEPCYVDYINTHN